MKQTIMNKLVKARAGLVLDHPFFGALALRMKLELSEECKTARTNGKVIQFNAQYADSKSLEELKGIMEHEVLHVANEHHLRRGSREHKKWNIACDYAINDILRDSGAKLPNDAFYPDIKGKSAEWYYGNMPMQDDKQNGQGNGQGENEDTFGEVVDLPSEDGQGNASESEKAQASADIRVAVSQAQIVSKQFGKLSSGMERMISELLNPLVPWKEILRRFVDMTARNDYSWTKPNKRYMSSGLYLPSLQSEELKPIVVAIDTSGSIDVTQLNQFAAEIGDIAKQGKTSLTIIYCDYVVNHVDLFEGDDEVRLRPYGGGGTSFVPPFEEVEKRDIQPACLVYLTDGECSEFAEYPDYPVLWGLTTRNSDFNPPYGETMVLQ